MNGYLALTTAAVFVWLGMVLAISFLEAPLKFRAPGVTVPIGLGIGRLVFKALNVCEVVLATAALVGVVLGRPHLGATLAVAIAVAALGIQVVMLRPVLSRRSDAVLADPSAAEGGRSRAHLVYVGLEVVKAMALVVGGVLLLGS